MKRSILRALALGLTAACATGYTWAQADSPTRPRSDRQPGTTSPPGLGTSSSAVSSGTRISSYPSQSQAGQPVRFSKLMNSNLKGQSGESLGQVQDIVLDPVSGQAQFVVLQLGGAAAVTPNTFPTTTPGATAGGNLVAVPWRLLTPAGDQFTATVDRAKLESAPTFNASTWPTMDSAWIQRVYSHFGVPSTGTGAPGSGTGTSSGTSSGTPDTGPGTGVGNPSTPGLPATPGTPDISPPSTRPGTIPPGTGAGTGPGPGGK